MDAQDIVNHLFAGVVIVVIVLAALWVIRKAGEKID
jgi:heme/copper-type cytochrome/quinol oxidase subunit 4